MPVAQELMQRLRRQGLNAVIVEEDQAGQTTKWFTEQEDAHDHVLLCASSSSESWIRVCARQADRILIVSPADADATTNLPGELLAQRAQHQLLDLVLLYQDSKEPSASGKWLAKVPVNRHFHIHLDNDADWNRLARVIGGRGVGLVLSGGGARAYAHIGVLQAIEEAGIDIDFYGGCSMGGIIAACRAVGWSVPELTDRIRRTFVETNPLSDYSLPIISLVKGDKVERLLTEHFGALEIPDTWMPFFCVSSNLTTAKAVVHKTGNLVQALRASIALPGILPPMITDEGVLADGAVISNLPVDAMRSIHRGPIAAG